MFAGGLGLAGLLLVFQGFIIGTYSALPPLTHQAVRSWYRIVVFVVLGVFILTLLSVAASLYWMLTGQSFRLVVGLFIAALSTLAALGIYVSVKLVG